MGPDPVPSAVGLIRCTVHRQTTFEEKHSQTQLLLNEIRDLYASSMSLILPVDPTNTSIGISEREIKTEEDEVVHKEITYRRISEDNSVLTSLMTARTDPTNATIDSPNGRAIQVMHSHARQV